MNTIIMDMYKHILEAVNRGIKFALDDFEDNEEIQGQTNSKVKYQHGTKEWLDLMNDVVDLGLPSGTLWCKYNLDVDPNQLSKNEDWFGKYYAWGEIESNLEFNQDNKLTKYCNNSKNGLNGFTGNLTELLPEDDAAYQNKKLYNFKFHIPTKEQCEELIKYTKNYWIKNYDPNKTIHNPKNDGGITKLNGRVFEGKNGNRIFIPSAGFYSSNSVRYGIDLGCSLWSSSLCLDNSDSAYYLYFDLDNIGLFGVNHYYLFNIRPVINL